MGNYKGSPSTMIKTLKILRSAGFYEDLINLTESEILEFLHQRHKQFILEHLNWNYDPDKSLSDKELVIRDHSKVLYLDLEADVSQENKVYTGLLQNIVEISNKIAVITEIKEYWHSERGPINISYKLNGEIVSYQPEYCDDWIDQDFLDSAILQVSKMTGQEFLICLGPNSDWLGQDICYIRLTKTERQVLENELQFIFFDTFLKSMRTNCP
jgi:hypothetical protein